jgi:hypothetical protein
MEAALALGGSVAGRIEAIESVADVINQCATECLEVLAKLRDRYLS